MPSPRAVRLLPVLFLWASLAAAPEQPWAERPGPDLPAPDTTLQSQLERSLRRDARLSSALDAGRLAVALLDISDEAQPRFAALHGDEMMYAASLPKIAILLAGFERILEGSLAYTQAVKEMFTQMVRRSSNAAASEAVRLIGFPYIAQTLRSDKYRLYDRAHNGGLWLGKAYGGPDDRWKRDPLHKLSHGASAAQVARFFWMLEQGRLVSPQYSAEMKEILSKPGISHKFVKGLSGRPNHEIYRKSGTWRNFHADGALIEAGDHKYIAVALMEDARGGQALPQIIVEMDRLVCGEDDFTRLAD